MNQKRFYTNMVDCARHEYIKTLSLAINGDFCKTDLDTFNRKISRDYNRYKNKPKKQFKLLVYAASLIYNNEIIVDSDICYNLNILSTIIKARLYRVHKFIQFVDKRHYTACFVPGMSLAKYMHIIKKLLEGVK